MLILVLNPGSTSTKIAVFKDRESIFGYNIRHSAEEIAKYPNVYSQFQFRKEAIISTLQKNEINLSKVEVVIGRGGLCKPIPSGVYRVNEQMMEDLKNCYSGEHASNLGALLAYQIAKEIGPNVPSFIADPVVVDEYEPIARFSGAAAIQRTSIFHALNQKAIAKKHAHNLGTSYDKLNVIVVHLGGGVSVGIHKQGRVVDVNNALLGEGPFSPDRAGGVPAKNLIDICFDGNHTKEEVIGMIIGGGGVISYVGTNSFQDVSKAAEEGDTKAKEVVEAFVYQVAKEIGSMATVVCGKVDAILLTGGIAYNDKLTNMIKERVSFIAPVNVYPGEDEMGALASNAYSVMTGKEAAKEY
ncbi:MAG: butyrate kinase [Bacteroidales bacterium]|nr:butyrate kinase [Bacteroidales bacterium]